MKVVLICPEDRAPITYLSENGPLVTVPIFGKSLLEHWMEFVAGQGAREVELRACSSSKPLEELVEDGARWGLEVHFDSSEENAANPPARQYTLDRLPREGAEDLSKSYADWFREIVQQLRSFREAPRVGARQVRPGVWVGRGTILPESCTILGPCWIGENVRLGADCTIGPDAIIEDFVVIERGAEIARSWIGPETFVGELIRIHDSLAWGSTLINWQLNSCINVPDAFLLSSMRHRKGGLGKRTGKLTARLQTTLGQWPTQVLAAVRTKLRG